MTGYDHGGHLIAQLRTREMRSGFGIARCDEQIEQVARRGARRQLQTLGDDGVHQRDPV